jgi:hypothetical protein
MELSLLTEVAQSILKDLAEWSLPNGSTIGGSIDDVQSTLEDIAEWILPNDKVSVAIPKEGAPEDR